MPGLTILPNMNTFRPTVAEKLQTESVMDRRRSLLWSASGRQVIERAHLAFG
jgi:hypothetical protein